MKGVITMLHNAMTVVKTKHENDEAFKVRWKYIRDRCMTVWGN